MKLCETYSRSSLEHSLQSMSPLSHSRIFDSPFFRRSSRTVLPCQATTLIQNEPNDQQGDEECVRMRQGKQKHPTFYSFSVCKLQYTDMINQGTSKQDKPRGSNSGPELLE